MCSALGITGFALDAVLIAGILSLGYNGVSVFKAGIAWFKHKFNLDQTTPAPTKPAA